MNIKHIALASIAPRLMLGGVALAIGWTSMVEALAALFVIEAMIICCFYIRKQVNDFHTAMQKKLHAFQFNFHSKKSLALDWDI